MEPGVIPKIDLELMEAYSCWPPSGENCWCLCPDPVMNQLDNALIASRHNPYPYMAHNKDELKVYFKTFRNEDKVCGGFFRYLPCLTWAKNCALYSDSCNEFFCKNACIFGAMTASPAGCAGPIYEALLSAYLGLNSFVSCTMGVGFSSCAVSTYLNACVCEKFAEHRNFLVYLPYPCCKAPVFPLARLVDTYYSSFCNCCLCFTCMDCFNFTYYFLHQSSIACFWCCGVTNGCCKVSPEINIFSDIWDLPKDSECCPAVEKNCCATMACMGLPCAVQFVESDIRNEDCCTSKSFYSSYCCCFTALICCKENDGCCDWKDHLKRSPCRGKSDTNDCSSACCLTYGYQNDCFCCVQAERLSKLKKQLESGKKSVTSSGSNVACKDTVVYSEVPEAFEI